MVCPLNPIGQLNTQFSAKALKAGKTNDTARDTAISLFIIFRLYSDESNNLYQSTVV